MRKILMLLLLANSGWANTLDDVVRFIDRILREDRNAYTANYLEPQKHIVRMNRWGDFFYTEDGAKWRVGLESSLRVRRHWRKGDTLRIQPNDSYLWGGDYKIVNKTRKSYAFVYMQKRPKCAPKIAQLNKEEGWVALDDGTTWLIDPQDAKEFVTWAKNAPILIGANKDKSLMGRSYARYIVINVTRNKFVRAEREMH
ncbi:MAG: hypothetical protein MRY21_08520 [Simkaniaceae bacterium]|nr:hypothetical protein [Simkaniaceae bacterium]